MVDYTDDDLERATGIVEGLETEKGRLRFGDLEDGLSVSDLEADAEQFYDDLSLLGRFGLDFPALRLGDKSLVPVALSEVIWPSVYIGPVRIWRDLYPSSYLRDLLDEEMQRGRARLDDAATLSRPEARKNFLSRASEFLASRIAGRRMLADGELPDQPRRELSMAQFIGGPRTKVSGCLFSVHTKSPGLSAYWSGAYYIHSNYHGAPTTPAKGVLQAGTYIFGVNGGAYGNRVQWDKKKVCTLPGTPSVTLQF